MAREGTFERVGRYVLGVLAAASFLVLVLAGTRVLSFSGATAGAGPQSQRAALDSAPAKAERQRQVALEAKIGECYAKGGVARLDPLAGYTGCDLPLPKGRAR